MTDDLLEVGRITKAHGLKGEVTVLLWSDVEERLDPGSVLETDAGPLTVFSSQPYQDRHLVRFEGISTRERAETLRGLLLRAMPLDVPGTLWVNELIGCTVETIEGDVIGTVASVEPNPASDLCVLEDGTLIPLVFVVEHEAGQRLVVDIPAGLLE